MVKVPAIPRYAPVPEPGTIGTGTVMLSDTEHVAGGRVMLHGMGEELLFELGDVEAEGAPAEVEFHFAVVSLVDLAVRVDGHGRPEVADCAGEQCPVVGSVAVDVVQQDVDL